MTAEARLFALLKRLAVQERPCKLCGAAMYIVQVPGGDHAYLTADGVDHFENCPKVPRPAASQERLFAPAAEAALDPK